MNLYTNASSMRSFKVRDEGSSAMTPPLIDRSKVASSLLLRCDQSSSISVCVSGLPFPQVTWYLGSRPIVDSPEFRVAMDADGRKHTLVVARVTEDLEGGLKVKAVNCAGQDQWEFEIKTYKLFSGRSQSDGNKFSTLPLLQPAGRRKGSTTPSPKTLHKKTNKRFEMTADEYENWQKEMERRSHMRSIDDILESLSDEDPDAVHPPSTENNTNSKDNSRIMETLPSSSSTTGSFPSSTRPVTVGSFQEQLSSESRTRDVAFRDGPPVGTDMPVSRKPEAPLCIRRGLKSATEARDVASTSMENDASLWEMFGFKLSKFCRTILASNAEVFKDRRSLHGIHDSTIQNLDDYFAKEASLPSNSQSRSVPVGRKALGSRLAENQTKPVLPDKTRILSARERVGQQRTAMVRPLSADPARSVPLLPDGGGSPNLRPPIQPKGQATQHVTQTLQGGSGCPNTRPPLAPKPFFKEEGHVRGAPNIAAQRPKTLETPGSLQFGSLDASLPRHRTEPRATNINSKLTPRAQTSQGRGAPSLDSCEIRDSAWEPSEKDASLRRISLDGGQNLVEWGPSVDRHFAEVRGESHRRRLEIKNPATTTREGVEEGGVSSGDILETHFNEPLSDAGYSQKIPDLLIRDSVSVLPANNSLGRVKAESIEFPAQSDVTRKKPPISKDKPFWSPATEVKGRGIPRTSPALASKAEHTEIGLKQNLSSQPTMSSDPQSIPSKPILVRRARSQSSGRSDEAMIDYEEEDTSGHLFGATSAGQLCYSVGPTAQNPTQKAEKFPHSEIGRFQASAAMSEGLLTARKLSASPTGSGAVDQNGGGREWRVRIPVSKSVDLLDAANGMETMQRIGRRSLSKEWQVVTVTTKEEITILHRPTSATTASLITNPNDNMTTNTDHFTNRTQLRPSKPFAV